MLQHSKHKIKTAVRHPDLMQVLYDELFAEHEQTMATITYSVTGQSSANSTFTTRAGNLSIATAQNAESKSHPDPAELLLAAYAASFAQVLHLAAEEQLIELSSVIVTASGELDPAWFLGLAKTTRAGLQKIQLTVKINSTANPEELVNLIQVARDRSPVADNLIQQTPAGFTLELPEVLAN
ncbi:MAG: OsmC family protein [Bacteroidia bacterium]